MYAVLLSDRVIKLGPVKDDMYDYSIITDKMKNSLYILARDVERFMDMYNDEVLEFVGEAGFESVTSSPLQQYQGDDCMYPKGFHTTGGKCLAHSTAITQSIIMSRYQAVADLLDKISHIPFQPIIINLCFIIFVYKPEF